MLSKVYLGEWSSFKKVLVFIFVLDSLGSWILFSVPGKMFIDFFFELIVGVKVHSLSSLASLSLNNFLAFSFYLAYFLCSTSYDGVNEFIS